MFVGLSVSVTRVFNAVIDELVEPFKGQPCLHYLQLKMPAMRIHADRLNRSLSPVGVTSNREHVLVPLPLQNAAFLMRSVGARTRLLGCQVHLL